MFDIGPLAFRLTLLGLAIPVIENLASHQGTYDVLNVTDNSITVLGNIPLGAFGLCDPVLMSSTAVVSDSRRKEPDLVD